MNFVDCKNCKDWSQERKFKNTCGICKGLGFIQDPKEILCNYCGGSMHPDPSDVNWQTPDGLLNAKVTGNYSTNHLTDEVLYIFSLCERCLRQLFNLCVIPPKIYDSRSPSVELNYDADKKHYEYDQWVKNGGFSKAYRDGKCNSVKDCKEKAKYTILYGNETFTENCCCETHLSDYNVTTWYVIVDFIPNNLRAFL